jgi:hypothetical protein
MNERSRQNIVEKNSKSKFKAKAGNEGKLFSFANIKRD